MRIEILDAAQQDLINGYHFYQGQAPGRGSYFLDSLFSDIDSLVLYAGIHPIVYGSHRCLASRLRHLLSDRSGRRSRSRCH